MNKIVFLDTEISLKTDQLLDIGAISDDGKIFHSNSFPDFVEFIKDVQYICGHNIIKHDLQYLKRHLPSSLYNNLKVIDTLFLSPLLFPKKPYHKLLKDEKLISNELNNPVNDSQKAKELFYDEVSAFNQLPESLKNIY